MQFELLFNVGTMILNGCSSTSLTWTDAQGQQQTISVKFGYSTVVSTSLPAGGMITWSSVPTPGQTAVFCWELQRGEAAILPSNPGYVNSACGKGSLYTNLTDRPVELDLAVWDYCPSGTFSWTDLEGQAHTLSPGSSAEGVTTSLPAGGTISFAGDGNNGAMYFWVIERPQVKLGNDGVASPEIQP